MIDKQFLEDEVFLKRSGAGIDWLIRSIEKTNTKGSAVYYSRIYKPLTGWAAPYPETTGYIIKTFFDYKDILPGKNLERIAHDATDWICGLQFENGALPGGAYPSTSPSVFNSGQMLIGLISAFENNGDQKYLDVIRKNVQWLMSILEDDGSWRQGSYVDGWIPSYYTRVIWPVLWANDHLKDKSVEEGMRKALNFYANRVTAKNSVKDWAFKSGQKAFTHTIAYTIRGFLESANILNDDDLKEISFNLGEKVMRLRELKGKMAGWYDEDWNGDYWFTCLTGNAQLSIILCQMYRDSGDLRYLNTALKIFDDIVYKQKLNSNKNINGALPGSAPFHGRYLIFRYPNWATKFYLDAYLMLKTEVDKLD